MQMRLIDQYGAYHYAKDLADLRRRYGKLEPLYNVTGTGLRLIGYVAGHFQLEICE